MPTRRAEAADADEVVRLAALMFASVDPDLGDGRWALEAARQVRERPPDEAAVFVVDAEDRDGGLAACAAGTIATRLPAPRNPSARVGYVQWVSTDPSYRRRGHARALMAALLDWYDDHGVTTVELHATADGEPLYRSLGFAEAPAPALRRRVAERQPLGRT